ncbi:MAG: ABC transporter permease [Myxococcota bacterium]
MKYLPFVLRNLWRNPLRTLLTIAAIAFAINLVSLLRTLPGGMDRVLNEYASKTRLSVTNEAGMVYPLPYAHLQKIAVLDGVAAAGSWTWLGGARDVDEGVAFPSFAIEPAGLAGVWADWPISAEAHAAFARQRNGAIVGRGTLDRNRWKVGDLVTLIGTALPVTLEFQIVGTIDAAGNPLFFFQREYLDQALRAQGFALDTAGSIWIRARDPSAVPRLLQEIEGLFRHSAAGAAAQTEKSYLGSLFSYLEDFLLLILLVTALVSLCVVFIASNTASLAIRERQGEIAVLRALGFPRRTVFSMLVAETTLLAAAAGALGTCSSLGLTSWLRASRFAAEFGPLGAFRVDAGIVLSSLAFSLAIGVVAGLLPSFQSTRLEPALALRRLD